MSQEDNTGPNGRTSKETDMNELTAAIHGEETAREVEELFGDGRPTTELVKLEADSDMTHALLCAVIHAQGSPPDSRPGVYEDELAEWRDVISDAYFADRE